MTKTNGVTVDEASLVASLCEDSFYEFVKEFWPVVIAETPVWNWHIKYLCDTFQHDAERVFKGLPKEQDTIVNIPPGTTKSTILSVMAPAWIHSRMPSARVLCGSHTQSLTFELGRKCKMIEDSPLYRAAFPNVIPSKDQWSKSFFMNQAGGGRIACTVGGMSPTGFHAHFILIDDPLDPQKAKAISGADIEAANNFMDEVIPSRKVDKAVTITWLIMQRLHQNDPSGHRLEKGSGVENQVRHICLPAQKDNSVRPLRLRRRYTGGLLDAQRLSQSVLDEAKLDLGEYGYSGQYRQNPVPRGGGMFKTTRLHIDTPPGLGSKQWVGLCRFWDKAGTRGGGAYTVGVLMGRWRPSGAPKDGSEDVWWVLDVQRDQLDSSEREALIKETAKRDGRRVIVGIEQEPGSGGKESAQATVKRLSGIARVRVVPAVGTKEERADEWSTMINAEAFRMKRAHWNQEFTDELKFFPYSTYKDQVDAGAGAYTILSRPAPRVGAA